MAGFWVVVKISGCQNLRFKITLFSQSALFKGRPSTIPISGRIVSGMTDGQPRRILVFLDRLSSITFAWGLGIANCILGR